MRSPRRECPGTRSARMSETPLWKSRSEQHNISSMCCSLSCSTVWAAGRTRRRSWCSGSCSRASRFGARRRVSSASTPTWISSSTTSASGRLPAKARKLRSAFAPSTSRWLWTDSGVADSSPMGTGWSSRAEPTRRISLSGIW